MACDSHEGRDALPTNPAPFQSARALSINKPLERPKYNFFFSSRGHSAAFQALCSLFHYQNSFLHLILDLPDCLNNPNVSIFPLNNTNSSQAKLELPHMKTCYLWPPEFQSLFYGLSSSKKDHKSTRSPQVQLCAFGSSKIFKITWRWTAPYWPSNQRGTETHIIPTWLWNKLPSASKKEKRKNFYGHSSGAGEPENLSWFN